MAAKLKVERTTLPTVLDAVDDPDLLAKGSSATPRYLLLARTLYNAIQSGAHPVGSLLPTELDLALQHGVSRQTVRQAMAQLRQQGLVSARKGVGTRIEAKQPPRRFSYSAMSASDLVEVAEGTELSIHATKIVAARGKLASELGCRANHRWLHISCSRTVDGESRLLSWINVYVDGRVSSALKLPSVLRAALFALVEKQSGETFVEIQQEIRATNLDAELAKRLDAEEGSAALEITRRYFSTGRRLIMISINTLPSDRFFYSVAMTRD
ncbi:GntR family transcriptional regulator [Acidisoma cellulosilytica]|uniref:GntR family transcriptional regulator n=1 Tax=Acidisoma cellulosilyticum TaxID=2802395 RepID=A0A963Z4P3_9PROT|nr:GntR family transcriptional regulator [Acidisoma cellulosilyticum]MCB8882579.1 GntR family transcriptional regulator [Acidisoma cellulosilyticum]